MSESVLERSVLERKERDELQAIARAMGARPPARARKADLVDLILTTAGIPSTTAGSDTAGSDTAGSDALESSAAGSDAAGSDRGAPDGPAPSANGTAAPEPTEAGVTPPPRARRRPRGSSTTELGGPEPDATGMTVNGAVANGSEPTTTDTSGRLAPSEGPDRETGDVGHEESTSGGAEGGGGTSDRSTTDDRSAARLGAPGEPSGRPSGDDRGPTSGDQDRDQGRGARSDPRAGESGEGGEGNRRRRRRGRDRERGQGGQGGQGGQNDRGQGDPRTEETWSGDPVVCAGLLDLRDEGYGFLRTKGYLASADDIYVSVKQVRQFGLRKGTT